MVDRGEILLNIKFEIVGVLLCVGFGSIECSRYSFAFAIGIGVVNQALLKKRFDDIDNRMMYYSITKRCSRNLTQYPFVINLKLFVVAKTIDFGFELIMNTQNLSIFIELKVCHTLRRFFATYRFFEALRRFSSEMICSYIVSSIRPPSNQSPLVAHPQKDNY